MNRLSFLRSMTLAAMLALLASGVNASAAVPQEVRGVEPPSVCPAQEGGAVDDAWDLVREAVDRVWGLAKWANDEAWCNAAWTANMVWGLL